jgi:formiminotetrahydrofolate cyclodeaminase/Zn-dependent peptidase ImmA (M78 family)
MSEPLIGLTAKELLEKFGKGSHKPGSGSAVALQGMLSAQMIKTVIDLTIGKKEFKDRIESFRSIKSEIEQKIYPELSRLLEDDSTQFNKVIVARRARNKAKDIEEKAKFENENLEEMKIATEMPILVAKHCLRLAECAIEVFDNGFQAVRGDSSVGINGSLSAVGGALSIVNLNLSSYNRNKWTEKILQEAEDLDKRYNELLAEAADRQKVLKEETEASHAFDLELENLKRKFLVSQRLSSDQIENFVTGIQNLAWDYKESLWRNEVEMSHLDILDPKIILKKLGYQYDQYQSLGLHEMNGESVEVAGLIDTDKKYVVISENFSFETIAFTSAHELGHALLHPGHVLHRDRPIDGSNTTITKDFRERQADKFAACFLMPRKLVLKEFKARFGVDRIHLDNRIAVELGTTVSELRKYCKSAQDFGKILANVSQVTYRTFGSLANEFGVSSGAMGIRLDELGVVTI